MNTYRLGDLGTEICCGPADLDIRIYKFVTKPERKVTTEHEIPEWERPVIVYRSPKTPAGTRPGKSDPMMRVTRVKYMTFMT